MIIPWRFYQSWGLIPGRNVLTLSKFNFLADRGQRWLEYLFVASLLVIVLLGRCLVHFLDVTTVVGCRRIVRMVVSLVWLFVFFSDDWDRGVSYRLHRFSTGRSEHSMLQLEHLYSGQTSLRPCSVKLILFDRASLPREVLRTSHLTGIQSVRTGSRLVGGGEGVDRHSTSFGSKRRRLFILMLLV